MFFLKLCVKKRSAVLLSRDPGPTPSCVAADSFCLPAMHLAQLNFVINMSIKTPVLLFIATYYLLYCRQFV